MKEDILDIPIARKIVKDYLIPKCQENRLILDKNGQLEKYRFPDPIRRIKICMDFPTLTFN